MSHSHHRCGRVLISPHSRQHSLLFVFLILAILVGVKWNLMVVLIGLSLKANGGDHLFMGYWP